MKCFVLKFAFTGKGWYNVIFHSLEFHGPFLTKYPRTAYPFTLASQTTKIFPLRIDQFLDRVLSLSKEYRRQQKCSSFNISEKHGDMLIRLMYLAAKETGKLVFFFKLIENKIYCIQEMYVTCKTT